MLKDSKFRFILFFSISFFSFLLVLFFLCFTSHGASESQINYPLIIDSEKNPSDVSIEDIQSAYSLMWGDLPSSYVIYCAFKSTTYINGSHGWDYYDYFQFVISTSPTFQYPNVLSTSGTDYILLSSLEYYFDYIPDIDHFGSFNTRTNSRQQYWYSQFEEGYGYLLFSTEESYFSTNNVLVWSYPPNLIPDGGELSPPDMSSLDLDSSLNTSTIPSAPTYSNNFNDPLPSYDNTSPFSSIFDIIIWGFNRVHSFFESFREYLFSWFGYFINILTYLIQKIINVIKFFVEWLYNQFLNWLTPYLKLWTFISKILFNEDEQLSIWDIIFQLLNYFIDWTHDFFTTFWSNSFINSFWTNFYNYLVSSYSEFIDDFLSVRGFFGYLYSHGLNNNNEFDLLVLFNYLFIPEPYQVVNLFYNHDPFHFISVITDVRSFIDIFISNFSDVEETYVVTLDSFTIAGVEMDSIDIDFSWYIPFKTAGDVVISAFLVFGYFMFLFFRLPYYLRGQAGNVSGSITEAQR